MSTTTTLNYIELLSACLSAAQQSAYVIVDALAQGNNHSILEKKDGPQTIADIGAQHIIQTGLRALYPNIQIVGEEPESSVDEYIQKYNVPAVPKLSQTLLTTTTKPLTYHDNNNNNDSGIVPTISTAFLPPILQDLDFSKVIIYIDPLDGTQEYTKGHKEHVTTLISITYDGHALGGVLYYPFTSEAVFGGMGLGCYSTANFKLTPPAVENQIEAIHKHPYFRQICSTWLDEHGANNQLPSTQLKNLSTATTTTTTTTTRRIVTSKSHLSPEIFTFFEKIGIDFETEVTSLGGAGHKGAQLLNGRADAYLYPRSGTNRWDIGVVEGLLFAHGGRVTDKYGQIYHYGLIDKVNDQGCICTIGVQHDLYTIPRDGAPL